MKKIIIVIAIILFLFPLSVKAEKSVESQINEIRKQNNLSELKIEKSLVNTAKFKSLDMYYHNYFNHTNIFGDDVLDIFKRFKVKFQYAGEILAKGYNKEEVLSAWLNSPTHQSVILDDEYNKIGCYEKNLIYVCHFSN